ncbi:gab-1 [Symbiodinium sp. KB8]|nr:gab-1 [Symbiodinium sp. KB8]
MRSTGVREFMSQAKNILSMQRTLGTIAAQVSDWEMNIEMLVWGYKEHDEVVLSRLHDRRLRHEGFWSHRQPCVQVETGHFSDSRLQCRPCSWIRGRKTGSRSLRLRVEQELLGER